MFLTFSSFDLKSSPMFLTRIPLVPLMPGTVLTSGNPVQHGIGSKHSCSFCGEGRHSTNLPSLLKISTSVSHGLWSIWQGWPTLRGNCFNLLQSVPSDLSVHVSIYYSWFVNFRQSILVSGDGRWGLSYFISLSTSLYSFSQNKCYNYGIKPKVNFSMYIKYSCLE